MNKKVCIENALGFRLSFYIFKGDESYLKKEIEGHFKDKEISIVYIDGDELDAENTRELITKLSVQYSQKKVFVISHFENVSQQVQNMLLKIIEELGEHKVLIALCNESDGILDTILSRSYYAYAPHDEKNDKSDFRLPIESNTLSAFRQLSQSLDDANLKQLVTSDLEDRACHLIVNHVLAYFDKTEANCNKELCLDLLIYRILEDKWTQKL